MKLERYRPRPDRQVAAVQLNLDTTGFSYRKWGADQFCKRGDWLVDNNGEVYSVDADSFARTYRRAGCGVYVKTTPVWAARAAQDGQIATREGVTRYRQGDYVVFNNEDGSDGYAVDEHTFASLYEPDEPGA